MQQRLSDFILIVPVFEDGQQIVDKNRDALGRLSLSAVLNVVDCPLNAVEDHHQRFIRRDLVLLDCPQ